MTGELVLPSSINCDEDCGVSLRNPKQYSEKIPIFLFIPLAGNTPAPNQMARLKDQYREEDFQVRMDNGSYAGNYSAVRITGKICQTTDGDVAICDISKIEPGK